MIASLSGKIIKMEGNQLILDVNGVGYFVTIPRCDANQLETNQEIFFFIYTQVKEDALQLFGFQTWEARDLFKLLLSVSGIGPKAALEIMSTMPLSHIKEGIHQKNAERFTQVPGIGKKTAERLIVELKGKLTEIIVTEGTFVAQPSSGEREEAIQALAALGYRDREIRQAVEKVARHGHPALSLENLIREALQIL